MRVAKYFGSLSDNITSLLQVLIYGMAYNSPAQQPLLWFTEPGFVCFISANILATIVVRVLSSVCLEVLKDLHTNLPESLMLLVGNLGRWLTPCVVFATIASYSPQNASYSSASFLFLSGVLLALINTLLTVMFDKTNARSKGLEALYFATMILMTVLAITTLNYAPVSGAVLETGALPFELTAIACLESAKYQDALNICDQSIKFFPQSSTLYNLRACAYQSLGRNREAILDCDRSISIKQDANTYVTRGYSWGLLNDREAQMRDYAAAMKFNPDNPSSYLYRARVYEKNGDHLQASVDREKASQLHYISDPFMTSQLKQ